MKTAQASGDQLVCDRRFRILNVVDGVTRECFAAALEASIWGGRAGRELAVLIFSRGEPGMIVSGHHPKLTSNATLACGRTRGLSKPL
jgi:hypothetical protein